MSKTTHFGFETVAEEEKAKRVAKVFTYNTSTGASGASNGGTGGGGGGIYSADPNNVGTTLSISGSTIGGPLAADGNKALGRALHRQVDSIRSFDPDTQRSNERLERVELLPAREFGLSPESIRDFRRRFRTRFEGDLTRMPLYRDVGEGLAPAGIEYYLPLFFETTTTLFDYLPAGSPVALPAGHDAVLLAQVLDEDLPPGPR